MKLVLLGPPGAGKGTQAEKIEARYSLAHISTGDMLRAEIASKTSLGIQAKALIDEGELIPDDVISAMVKNRIAQLDCINGFLLDGYPRNIAQAHILMGFTHIDRAICITVPDGDIIARMAFRRVCPLCKRTYSADTHKAEYCECGGKLYAREDDKPETVRHRLLVYEEQTQPLVDFFRARGVLSEIDGTGDVDTVSQRIYALLDSKMGHGGAEG